MKEKIISNLGKFGYKFQDKETSIIVDLNFNLRIIINIHENSLVLKTTFKGWNPINGFLGGSFSNLLVQLSVSLFLSLIIAQFGIVLFPNFNFSPILIIFSALSIIWTIYYKISIESFKIQLSQWLN